MRFFSHNWLSKKNLSEDEKKIIPRPAEESDPIFIFKKRLSYYSQKHTEIKYIDMTNIFDDNVETVYSDTCHVLNKYQKNIAEAIYHEIIKCPSRLCEFLKK